MISASASGVSPGTRTRPAILIDADADIHAQDDLGQTALVYVMHGTLGRAIGKAGDGKAAVQLLIEKGANIEVVDHDGQTPLMHAAAVPSDDVAKILVEAGADISKVNKQGETALEIARRIWRNSQQPVVEYLETVFEQRSRQ